MSEIRLVVDQQTQAAELRQVVTDLERMRTLLAEISKYNGLINRAAGNPQELIRLSAEMQRLEQQLLRTEQMRSNAAAAATRASEVESRAADRAASAEERKRRALAAQAGLIGAVQNRIQQLNRARIQADTPERLERINRLLQQQQQRLRELRNTGQQTTNTFGNALSSFQFKFNFLGNAMASLSANAAGAVKDFASEAIQMSLQADGIRKAFDRLNNPALLDQLRVATNGTVSDLELMRSAVKASNFKLPLDQLATYLKFAQQRALETGESVDYLVESIVTGISRKSIPIMDNLGISATSLQTEFKKTGDFGKAAANIIDEELAKTNGGIDNQLVKVQQLNAVWENFKVSLGDFLIDAGTAILQWADLLSGKLSYAELRVQNFSAAMRDEGKKTADTLINTINSVAKNTEEQAKGAQIVIDKLLAQRQVLNKQYDTQQVDAESYIYQATAIDSAIARLKQYKKQAETPISDPVGDSVAERVARDYTELENQIRLIDDLREKEIAENELAKQKELDQAADKGYDKTKIAEYYRLKEIEINQKYDDEEIKRITEQGEAEQDAIIANKIKQREKEKQQAKERRDLIVDLQKEEADIIAQMEEDNLKREEKISERRKELAESVIDSAISGIERRGAAQTAAIEDEITKQRDAVQQQRELAAQGSANTLAAEEKLLADLERKKIQAAKKQENAKYLEMFLNFVTAFANDDPQTAPRRALEQTGVVRGFSALFMEKGGIAADAKETTVIKPGSLSRSHKSGDILAVLSPKEGILNEQQMQNLGGKDGFYSLQKLLDNPINDDVFRPVESFAGIITTKAQQINLAPVVEKLTSVEQAIKRIPGNNFAVDTFGNLIHTKISEGNKTITNKGRFVSPSRKKYLD